MTCKFERYEQDGNIVNVKRYTCSEVRELNNQWKDEMRIKNQTDNVIKSGRKDKYYDDYCQQIDDFLAGCSCIDR
jgi:hypothetical protein